MLSLVEKGVEAINNAYQNMKFDRKVAKINELMTDFMLEEDLNLAVASASIQVARFKKADILSKYEPPVPQSAHSSSSLSRGKDKIEEKIKEFQLKVDGMLTKMTKISSVPETPASKLAIKDIILFINHVATHEVTTITRDNAPSLDKIITEVFANSIGSSTDQAIRQAITADASHSSSGSTNDKAKDKDSCIVSMADKITYDNKLLNHPELLKDAMKYFGMNKTIDLSQLLLADLVSEAIHTQDQSLILAGMLSIEELG